MKKILLTIVCLLCMTATANAAAWQIQEARTYYANGQYINALNSITNEIESSSANDPDAYMLRLNIYKKLNDEKYNDKMINDIDKIIKLTNNISLYETRGYINIKSGNYMEACSDFVNLMQDGDRLRVIKAKTWLIKIANSVNAHWEPRFAACGSAGLIYMALGKDAEGYAAFFKGYQIMSLASEDDFKEKSKKETMKLIKDAFFSSCFFSDMTPLQKEFFTGLYEYSTGNKELGSKIINGVINELISRNEKHLADELTNIFTCTKKYLTNGLQDIVLN